MCVYLIQTLSSPPESGAVGKTQIPGLSSLSVATTKVFSFLVTFYYLHPIHEPSPRQGVPTRSLPYLYYGNNCSQK
jgi:hypothetical protein